MPNKTPMQIDRSATCLVPKIVLPQIAKERGSETRILDYRLKIERYEHLFRSAALSWSNQNIDIVEFPELRAAIDLFAQHRTFKKQSGNPHSFERSRQLDDLGSRLHYPKSVAALKVG